MSHTYTHTHMHTHTRIHAHTHTHAHMHTQLYVCPQQRMLVHSLLCTDSKQVQAGLSDVHAYPKVTW